MAKKISLSDLESLKGLKEARGDFQGQGGPRAGIKSLGPASLQKRNEILDKAIAKFTYVVDNLDQETASYVKSLFNDQLQLGYETTMSGLKQDAFAKTGFVPIDKETIYSAIVNLDLPKDLKLEMNAIADTADKKDLAVSLANNDLGITYDSESQEIKGQYQFSSKDGKTFIKPIVTKDSDSKVKKRVEIERAIDGGGLYLDATKGEDTQIDFMGVKDGNVLNLQKNIGTDNNLSGDLTTKIPLYMLKDNQTPTLTSDFYKDKDFSNYGIGMNFPITKNLSADISTQKYDDDTSADKLGLYYNKAIGDSGILSFGADIDTDRNKNLMFNFSLPFGDGDFPERESILMPQSEKRALEELKKENTMLFDGKEYQKNRIYEGSDVKELIEAASVFSPKDFIGPVKKMAGGGLAYLMGM
jgi:hypothetical protein